MSAFRHFLPLPALIGAWLGGTSLICEGQSPADQPLNPQLEFDHLTGQQGLSNNTISTVLQDQQGFMWFGTWNGLNRYDGYEFTTYRHNPKDSNSLSGNWVNSMIQDRQGAFWIGTTTGLTHFDPLTSTCTRYGYDNGNPKSLSNNFVNEKALCLDRQGALWIGTQAGLNRFDSATHSFRRYTHLVDDPASISHDDVTALFEDHSGQLWAGTAQGLNRWEPIAQRWHTPSSDARLRESTAWGPIHAICQDTQGFIWVATELGIYRGNPRTGIFSPFWRIWTNSLYVDHQGLLWMGSHFSVCFITILSWIPSSTLAMTLTMPVA